MNKFWGKAFLYFTSLVAFVEAFFLHRLELNSTHYATNFHGSVTLETSKKIPLQGKRLRAVFYPYEPQTVIKETYGGFDYIIFQEFSTKYNCTVEMIQSNWKLDTRRNESIPPYLNKLSSGEYDVIVPGIFITEIRHKYADISVPYTQSSVHLLTPKPGRFQNLWSIFLPFENIVWFTVLCYVVLSSLVLFALAVAHHSLDSTYMKNDPYLEYSYCVLNAIGATISMSLHTGKSFAIRHVLTWCLMVSTLLVTAYNCNFVSFLTVPLYTKPIDTLEEFLESGLQWTSSVESWVNIMEESRDSKILEISQRFILAHTGSELNKLARSHKFSLVADKLEPGRICRIGLLESKILSKFYLMKDKIQSFSVAFLFKKNSPFVQYFNSFLGPLRDSGIVDRWVFDSADKYLPSDYLLPLKYERVDDHTLRAISKDDIAGTFVLIFIGLVLSLISFVTEKISNILSCRLAHI